MATAITGFVPRLIQFAREKVRLNSAAALSIEIKST
jgi:hypothetical protein